MIAARPHGIPQGRKPGAFDQRGVGGELGPGHAAGVERVHVVRVCRQAFLLQLQGSIHQTLDLILDLRIRWTVRRGNKTVVGVLSRIQHAHAVEFPEQGRGQEMIDRERIVRMPPQHLFELLHRPVVVEIVEMVERGQVQRIMGTIRKGCRVGIWSRHRLRSQQNAHQEQKGAAWKGRKQILSRRSLCTLVYLKQAGVCREPRRLRFASETRLKVCL